MPQPTAHEHETAVDPITRREAGICNRGAKFRLGLQRQNLVRVQDKDSIIAQRKMLQSPVFLLRLGAVELELHYLRPKFIRDALRSVRALRVNHENLSRPTSRAQAARRFSASFLTGTMSETGTDRVRLSTAEERLEKT
jgi:hypothetical protein